MMKKWMKKAGMVAASLAALTTLVSAGPVKADASRIVYFTFQNNNACTETTHYTSLYFNVTNISNSSTNVNVHFYNEAGVELSDTVTAINPSGTTGVNGYYLSNYKPSNDFELSGKKTMHYLATFGGGSSNLSCTARPAYGKIVVESDNGSIIANGEIKGVQVSPYIILSSTAITVNEGKPF